MDSEVVQATREAVGGLPAPRLDLPLEQYRQIASIDSDVLVETAISGESAAEWLRERGWDVRTRGERSPEYPISFELYGVNPDPSGGVITSVGFLDDPETFEVVARVYREPVREILVRVVEFQGGIE